MHSDDRARRLRETNAGASARGGMNKARGVRGEDLPPEPDPSVVGEPVATDASADEDDTETTEKDGS